jgi:single-strand selective monofunctional uracil DNA glycosylase
MLLKTQALHAELKAIPLAESVPYAYYPMDYAWEVYAAYVERFGQGQKKILYLGMNPGPFGMAQTGIPFGEVQAVQRFLKLGPPLTIHQPDNMHPKRPVLGWGCKRSEVSGKRLWAWFEERYGSLEAFAQENFVLNYCPVLYLSETGANIALDQLPKADLNAIIRLCDAHLADCVQALGAQWVIGVGQFAAKRAMEVVERHPHLKAVKVGSILHPSPANPHANRAPWGETATRQLAALGLD